MTTTTTTVTVTTDESPIYEAALTQLGSSAPTAVIKKDSLNNPITWTRDKAGQYFGVFETPVNTDLKVIRVLHGDSAPLSTDYYNVEIKAWAEMSMIVLQSKNQETGLLQDAGIENMPIEISIYDIPTV